MIPADIGTELQMANMLRQEFQDFLFPTNTDIRSAASYIRALDMLGPILMQHYPRPIVNGSMRHFISRPNKTKRFYPENAICVPAIHEIVSSSYLANYGSLR